MVCVHDAQLSGFNCITKEKMDVFKSYQDTDGLIALPPSDFGELLKFCHKYPTRF